MPKIIVHSKRMACATATEVTVNANHHRNDVLRAANPSNKRVACSASSPSGILIELKAKAIKKPPITRAEVVSV